MTLLPAMLGFAGTKVAKFTRLPLLGARAERVARRSAADPDSTAGAGWARFVVRHRVPVLIGGIVVRLGDTIIDGSVAGQLRRLRQQLLVGSV